MGEHPPETFEDTRRQSGEFFDVDIYRERVKTHESDILDLMPVRVEILSCSLWEDLVEESFDRASDLKEYDLKKRKDFMKYVSQVYASCKLSESFANSSRVRVSALRVGSMPAEASAFDSISLS